MMDMGMATGTTASSSRAKNRGRRSNNNDKAAVVIAHECPSVMRAHVLEVPAGRDVVSCVAQFARRVRRGALVLGAAGRVTDVVLRDLPLGGTMEILNMAGFFFPSGASASAAVFLAGPRGDVLGGGVRRVVAAGPVVVMVATFVAAALDRLPLESAGKPHLLRLSASSGSGWALCRRKLSATKTTS